MQPKSPVTLHPPLPNSLNPLLCDLRKHVIIESAQINLFPRHIYTCFSLQIEKEGFFFTTEKESGSSSKSGKVV